MIRRVGAVVRRRRTRSGTARSALVLSARGSGPSPIGRVLETLGGISDDHRRHPLSRTRRDRGVLGVRQDACAAPDHTAVAGPRDGHDRTWFHPRPGRVRLSGRHRHEGVQPLLLRVVPPASRPGRDRGSHDPLPGRGRQDGAPDRQAVGRHVVPDDPRAQRSRTRCRLLGDDRWRAVRQVQRDVELDGGDVVRPRPHQLRAHLGGGTVRPVRGGHAARRPHRGVPDPAGIPHPTGRRRARPVAAEPAGEGEPGAHEAVRRDASTRSRGGPRTVRRGTRLPRPAARVPVRLRLAQRRGLRPRRRALAGEPCDPTRQHRPLRPDGRQPRPDHPVQPRRQAARGVDRQDPGQARRRSRAPREVRGAVRGRPVPRTR